MRKRIIAVFALILMVSMVFATGSGESTDAGTKLVIAGEAGSPQFMYFKSIGPEYTAQTGVEVEFIELPHDNMHERFVQESISRSGAIDIYNADQPWISEFASRGWIEPLDDLISDEDRADFLSSALDASSYQGKLYAIPYFIHTPIVFYRTDLFEEAGFSVPTTWEEYREAAKKLTDPETGVYGTIIEAKQATEPVTHLVDWYFQNGAEFVDGEGNVVVDSPEAKEVFEFLLEMMYEDQSVMPGSVGYDNADAHNLFMQGKVAMIKNWPYMYAMARDPEQSLVSDDFAIARQPAGKYDSTAVWTWGFAISSSSRNKEAAWDFIQWATSAENLAQMGIQNLMPVPRHSSFDIVKASEDISEKDKEAILLMSEALDVGRNATESPVFPSIQSEMGTVLSRIMSKQVSVEEGLSEAREALERIVE